MLSIPLTIDISINHGTEKTCNKEQNCSLLANAMVCFVCTPSIFNKPAKFHITTLQGSEFNFGACYRNNMSLQMRGFQI